MLTQPRTLGTLLGAFLTCTCIASCGGERGGLDADISGTSGANISAQKLTSKNVSGYAGYALTSEISRQDVTTDDLEANPSCVKFALTVCGIDFAKGTYKAIPDPSGLGGSCDEGSAWIAIDEAGSDCRGELKRWTPSGGSIVIESVDDNEVHASFDVSMQPLINVVSNAATGVFHVKGTIWSDDIQRLE